MSNELLMRSLFCGIAGLILAWTIFSGYDAEIGTEITGEETDRQRYLIYPGGLLPLFLLFIGILSIGLMGAHSTFKMTLSLCFGIFLHISIYYLLLLLILPFFRKRISARSCAMLWFLPNYLYIMALDVMELPGPRFILRAPGNSAYIIFLIWLTGFSFVFLRKLTEHLHFRKKVLLDSFEVTDPDILLVWNKVIEDTRIKKPKFKLICSPNVKTPLSIGLFQRTIRVVLPNRPYSAEELELILRHEIIHIAREDSWSKFFLMFCTAMCWFNPLMWIAAGKSADDLELSCDETVLLNADETVRKKYAALILNTAGDERGFTTCLAASKHSMRYRLKNIVQPKKRTSGAIVLGLILFSLCMSSGYVALAYGGTSGAELIYQNKGYKDFSISHISFPSEYSWENYELIDEAAFHEYLSGLTFLDLTGNYSFADSDRQMTYFLDTPEGVIAVCLHDRIAEITRLHKREQEYFYIEEGIDWNYIDSIIKIYPSLTIDFIREDDSAEKNFAARLDLLWKTVDGQKELIYDSDYPEQEYDTGLFGFAPFDQASFTFTKELAAPCSVRIETWDRNSSCLVTQDDIMKPFAFDMPSYPAHYTVYASFPDESGATYDAEFRFDIGNLEN